jgi:hypothetical protein
MHQRKFNMDEVSSRIRDAWFENLVKVPRYRHREYLKSLVEQVVEAELSRIGVRYS